MSEREYSRLQVQLKPFFTLLVVVASSLFIASCGGGSESPVAPTAAVSSSDSSTDEGMAKALAVSGSTGMVPGGWVGRKPINTAGAIPYSLKKLVLKDKYAQPDDTSGYILNQYWVTSYKISSSDLSIKLKAFPLLKVIAFRESAGGFLIEFDDANLEALSQLTSVSNIPDISIHQRQHTGKNLSKDLKVSDDGSSYADEGDNWHLEYVKIPAAWDITTGATGQLVGIIDSGLYSGHEEFKDRIHKKYTDLSDRHGTAVASTMVGVANNKTGVAGINWEAKAIVHHYGTSTEEAAENYRRLLLDNPTVRVVNNSWSYASCKIDCSTEKIAIDRTFEFRRIAWDFPQVVHVWAAGNGGRDARFENGALHHESSGNIVRLDNIIVVAALLKSGQLEPTSDDGASVDIAAPTEYRAAKGYLFGISSYWNAATVAAYGTETNGTAAFDGTSAAAPVVSGVVSLMLAINPDLKASEVRRILISTADRVATHRNNIEIGRPIPIINAEAAVKEAIRRKNIGTETLESAFTSNSTLSAPWSFGWQVSSGVAPIPYASFQPAGSRSDYPTFAIWNKVSGSAGSPPIDVYPWVVKNMGANPVLYSPLAAPFPAQSVIVTPGSSGEKAVFRWTAPVAGTYEINASYELMQGGEVDVHVQRNGIDIFSANIARQGSQAIVPAQRVTLSAGDTIDFVVGNGGNTQNSDITRVSASVKSAVGIGTIREKALWGNNGWTDSDTLPVCGVNWYRAGDGGTGKTLLQINHAEVPVSANRIFLNLYTRTWDNGGDASAEIYQVTQAWDPATVLWQTIPTTISAPSATFQLPANTPDNWVKVEITSLVKAWQGGTSNNGMLIDSKIEPWSYCRSFYSSNVEGKKPHVSWE